MGYYSETGLALTRKGRKLLQRKIKTLPDDIAENVKGLLNNPDRHCFDHHTQAEIWLWDSLKWYSGDAKWYPEIDFLDKFIGGLDEEEYRFIRIGEDYDDTESKGLFTENPFDFELVRGISCKPEERNSQASRSGTKDATKALKGQ